MNNQGNSSSWINMDNKGLVLLKSEIRFLNISLQERFENGKNKFGKQRWGILPSQKWSSSRRIILDWIGPIYWFMCNKWVQVGDCCGEYWVNFRHNKLQASAWVPFLVQFVYLHFEVLEVRVPEKRVLLVKVRLFPCTLVLRFILDQFAWSTIAAAFYNVVRPLYAVLYLLSVSSGQKSASHDLVSVWVRQ